MKGRMFLSSRIILGSYQVKYELNSSANPAGKNPKEGLFLHG